MGAQISEVANSVGAFLREQGRHKGVYKASAGFYRLKGVRRG